VSNTGHGWVVPRDDGMKARCGGPGLCAECRRERASLPMAPEPEDSEAAWADWFDVQHVIGSKVDLLLEEAQDGHSDQFMAAVTASLIEHLAEWQRRYLHLPASDENKSGESAQPG
jgi:hypothetical protein